MKSKYKQGDIIFIPYPFTDLSGTKKRPVIIISKNEINSPNFIAAKITSVIRNDKFSFELKEQNLTIPLKKESEVRTNEIFTVHKSLILRKFTNLHEISLSNLTDAIISHIETDNKKIIQNN